MADFGYLSQKISGAINSFVCGSAMKNSQKLPAGRYVSLCFDDFPQSAAVTAAPMIEALGWRATWYVAGGFEGGEDENLGEMYTDDDLRRLIAAGHDIGCHTFDHVDCSKAKPREIFDQCAKSSDYLRQFGIRDVDSFAFPFGAASAQAKKVMSETDLALRGVKPGINRGKVDLSMLKACGLQDNQGGILRAIEELENLSKRDGWLIIFTHDVREQPSPWGVTPEDYDLLLGAIYASGADVVTVGDMVRRINGHLPAPQKLAA